MAGRQIPDAVRRGGLVALVVVPLAAFSYWFLACPCDRMPGGLFSGGGRRGARRRLEVR